MRCLTSFSMCYRRRFLVAAAAAGTAARTGLHAAAARPRIAGLRRRAEYRKLQTIAPARAVRAGHRRTPRQHDLLVARSAIVANVFVDRHSLYPQRYSRNKPNYKATVEPGCEYLSALLPPSPRLRRANATPTFSISITFQSHFKSNDLASISFWTSCGCIFRIGNNILD